MIYALSAVLTLLLVSGLVLDTINKKRVAQKEHDPGLHFLLSNSFKVIQEKKGIHYREGALGM